MESGTRDFYSSSASFISWRVGNRCRRFFPSSFLCLVTETGSAVRYLCVHNPLFPLFYYVPSSSSHLTLPTGNFGGKHSTTPGRKRRSCAIFGGGRTRSASAVKTALKMCTLFLLVPFLLAVSAAEEGGSCCTAKEHEIVSPCAGE